MWEDEWGEFGEARLESLTHPEEQQGCQRRGVRFRKGWTKGILGDEGIMKGKMKLTKDKGGDEKVEAKIIGGRK